MKTEQLGPLKRLNGCWQSLKASTYSSKLNRCVVQQWPKQPETVQRPEAFSTNTVLGKRFLNRTVGELPDQGGNRCCGQGPAKVMESAPQQAIVQQPVQVPCCTSFLPVARRLNRNQLIQSSPPRLCWNMAEIIPRPPKPWPI